MKFYPNSYMVVMGRVVQIFVLVCALIYAENVFAALLFIIMLITWIFFFETKWVEIGANAVVIKTYFYEDIVMLKDISRAERIGLFSQSRKQIRFLLKNGYSTDCWVINFNSDNLNGIISVINKSCDCGVP